MPFGFMDRLRNGYGNIYTPHAGSMIIQEQRETGLANRTIVFTERQVALLRVLGSRVGIIIATLFLGTWLVFAMLSVRVPMLSGRIAKLERENRRIDSLQVALSRMHGRYEQVRQLLGAAGGGSSRAEAESARGQPTAPTRSATPNASSTVSPPASATSPPDTTATIVR